MIMIDEKTRIKTDKSNFILERLEDTTKRDGSTSKEWNTKGYYYKLSDVIQAVLRLEVKKVLTMI